MKQFVMRNNFAYNGPYIDPKPCCPWCERAKIDGREHIIRHGDHWTCAVHGGMWWREITLGK